MTPSEFTIVHSEGIVLWRHDDKQTLTVGELVLSVEFLAAHRSSEGIRKHIDADIFPHFPPRIIPLQAQFKFLKLPM